MMVPKYSDLVMICAVYIRFFNIFNILGSGSPAGLCTSTTSPLFVRNTVRNVLELLLSHSYQTPVEPFLHNFHMQESRGNRNGIQNRGPWTIPVQMSVKHRSTLQFFNRIPEFFRNLRHQSGKPGKNHRF